MLMFCPNCGNKLGTEDLYCEVCGWQIAATQKMNAKSNRKPTPKIFFLVAAITLICIAATATILLQKAPLSSEHSSIPILSETAVVTVTPQLTRIDDGVFTEPSPLVTTLLEMPEVESNVPAVKLGNTSGNIMNRGLVCADGGWLYFFLHVNNTNGFVFKMREDGGEKIKISPGGYEIFLNASEDWVYGFPYMCDCYYRTKIDGTEGANLTDAYMGLHQYPYLIEDSIYISLNDDCVDFALKNLILYRMNKDGSNQTALAEQAAMIGAEGNWIYYVDFGAYANSPDGQKPKSGASFFRMHCDGSEKQLLFELSSDHCPFEYSQGDLYLSVIVQDGWIYYANSEEGGETFYKLRVNGKDYQKIAHLTKPTKIFNIHKDWIYYFYDKNYYDYSGSNCALYKMRIDGSGQQIVVDGIQNDDHFGRGIYITDKWVYWYSEKGLCRVNADTGEQQLFCKY